MPAAKQLRYNYGVSDFSRVYRSTSPPTVMAPELQQDRQEGELLPFFLLGHHAHSNYLQALLHLSPPPTLLPARLSSFRAVNHDNGNGNSNQYMQILAPTNNAADFVDGSAYTPRSAEEQRILEGLANWVESEVSCVNFEVWVGWRKKTVAGRAVVCVGEGERKRREAKLYWDKVNEEQKRKKQREADEYWAKANRERMIRESKEYWDKVNAERKRVLAERERVMLEKLRGRVYEKVWGWLEGVVEDVEDEKRVWG